jgi:predicted nucleic acid-binding protein
MIVVLDASAALEITLQREQSAQLSQYIADAEWVIAPTLFIAETTNVMWKYKNLGGYSSKDCTKYLEQIIALPDDFSDDLLLYREAFKLGCQLKHSIYDMLYLILSRRNDAIFLSMDKKLIKLAKESGIETQ